MTTIELIEQASVLISEWATESKVIEPNRLDVAIDLDHLLAAVGALVQARWGYLAAITGLDPGPATGKLEVLYHFCNVAAVATLRVPISRTDASIPSIQPLIPPALFFERELAEMFGIRIGALKEDDHLFLPEDWPNGVYPLRKDYQPSESKV